MVRADALVERAADAVRVLLALRPRAVALGLSGFLAAGVAGFTGVAAFFAGVTGLLGTFRAGFDGVEVLTTALAGLADREVALGGEATASAAFLAAALFGLTSSFLAGAVEAARVLLVARFLGAVCFFCADSLTDSETCCSFRIFNRSRTISVLGDNILIYSGSVLHVCKSQSNGDNQDKHRSGDSSEVIHILRIILPRLNIHLIQPGLHITSIVIRALTCSCTYADHVPALTL